MMTGIVAAMAHAGGGQRAVQLHFDALHLLQLIALAQPLHEQRRRPHRAYGVGAGGADANLEQVKHADSHVHKPRGRMSAPIISPLAPSGV
jgi:hypothetical protein